MGFIIRIIFDNNLKATSVPSTIADFNLSSYLKAYF